MSIQGGLGSALEPERLGPDSLCGGRQSAAHPPSQARSSRAAPASESLSHGGRAPSQACTARGGRLAAASCDEVPSESCLGSQAFSSSAQRRRRVRLGVCRAV